MADGEEQIDIAADLINNGGKLLSSEEIIISEITVGDDSSQLHKILESCNLLEYFDKFIAEEISDENIVKLNPESPRFWKIASTIFEKMGTQMKFQEGLANFQKEQSKIVKPETSQTRMDENFDETPPDYKPFNIHEVSY